MSQTRRRNTRELQSLGLSVLSGPSTIRPKLQLLQSQSATQAESQSATTFQVESQSASARNNLILETTLQAEPEVPKRPNINEANISTLTMDSSAESTLQGHVDGDNTVSNIQINCESKVKDNFRETISKWHDVDVTVSNRQDNSYNSVAKLGDTLNIDCDTFFRIWDKDANAGDACNGNVKQAVLKRPDDTDQAFSKQPDDDNFSKRWDKTDDGTDLKCRDNCRKLLSKSFDDFEKNHDRNTGSLKEDVTRDAKRRRKTCESIVSHYNLRGVQYKSLKKQIKTGQGKSGRNPEQSSSKVQKWVSRPSTLIRRSYYPSECAQHRPCKAVYKVFTKIQNVPATKRAMSRCACNNCWKVPRLEETITQLREKISELERAQIFCHPIKDDFFSDGELEFGKNNSKNTCDQNTFNNIYNVGIQTNSKFNVCVTESDITVKELKSFRSEFNDKLENVESINKNPDLDHIEIKSFMSPSKSSITTPDLNNIEIEFDKADIRFNSTESNMNVDGDESCPTASKFDSNLNPIDLSFNGSESSEDIDVENSGTETEYNFIDFVGCSTEACVTSSTITLKRAESCTNILETHQISGAEKIESSVTETGLNLVTDTEMCNNGSASKIDHEEENRDVLSQAVRMSRFNCEGMKSSRAIDDLQINEKQAAEAQYPPNNLVSSNKVTETPVLIVKDVIELPAIVDCVIPNIETVNLESTLESDVHLKTTTAEAQNLKGVVSVTIDSLSLVQAVPMQQNSRTVVDCEASSRSDSQAKISQDFRAKLFDDEDEEIRWCDVDYLLAKYSAAKAKVTSSNSAQVVCADAKKLVINDAKQIAKNESVKVSSDDAIKLSADAFVNSTDAIESYGDALKLSSCSENLRQEVASQVKNKIGETANIKNGAPNPTVKRETVIGESPTVEVTKLKNEDQNQGNFKNDGTLQFQEADFPKRRKIKKGASETRTPVQYKTFLLKDGTVARMVWRPPRQPCHDFLCRICDTPLRRVSVLQFQQHVKVHFFSAKLRPTEEQKKFFDPVLNKIT